MSSRLAMAHREGTLTTHQGGIRELSSHHPLLDYESILRIAADAYAEWSHQKHPYVSPALADWGRGFLQTLMQSGTRETS